MRPVSLILPEHHHVVLTVSLHNRVSSTATGLTCTIVLVGARTCAARHLKRWVRGLPQALPEPVSRMFPRDLR